jgi:SHS2 domain-containing protein
VALRVFGGNREALLENAARGMFSVMLDLDSVPLRGAVHVQVEAASFGDLLAQWLKELIYLFDVEGWAFANFRVEELSAPKPDENGMWRLSATAEGGPLSETVRTGAAVKAVTYHSFSVRQVADGAWQAHLVFDI